MKHNRSMMIVLLPEIITPQIAAEYGIVWQRDGTMVNSQRFAVSSDVQCRPRCGRGIPSSEPCSACTVRNLLLMQRSGCISALGLQMKRTEAA